MFERDFERWLKENTSIMAWIHGRVYPLVLPQKVHYPAITYQIISALRNETHDRQSGLVEARVQITCFGTNYVALKEMCSDLRTQLESLVGTIYETVISACECIEESDDYDDNTELFMIPWDYRIWYQENTA